MEEFGGRLKRVMRRIVSSVTFDKMEFESVLNELKAALIDADVDVSFTLDFISNLRKKCMEEKVPPGMTLREHVIKVLYDELVRILGEKPGEISGKKRIMFVGLYGVGKTTTVVKVARYFQKRGLKVAIICADYHRPAASVQLKQLAEKIHVSVYVDGDGNPLKAIEDGLKRFKNFDVILLDTAGRDALDEKLAEELKQIASSFSPDETLLVIPADIGKVAGRLSSEFNKLVGIDGVVITRMDGTAKGGGALTSCYLTGAKVKFIGTGEKIEDLELYDPKKFVSRLLGLGDLESLIEKAREAEVKEEKLEKIVEGDFTLEDFMEQIRSLQRMGPLKQIFSLLPGVGMMKIPEELLEMQEKKLKKFVAIIQSMTPEERRDPSIINYSRIKRIARGSGTCEADVRELLNQYNAFKKLMKSFGGLKQLRRGGLRDLARTLGLSF